MTPVHYWGSSNDWIHASEAARSGLLADGVKGGRDARVAARHKAERFVWIIMYYEGGADTTHTEFLDTQ